MYEWDMTCNIPVPCIVTDYDELITSAGDQVTINPVHSDQCESKKRNLRQR
jgi:hypothetical protein